MPVERVGSFIRARIQSPPLFSEFRYKTLSESQGIFAILGKRKSNGDWEIQAYRFAVDKGWTVAKARSWLKEHEIDVKYMTIEGGEDEEEEGQWEEEDEQR